MSMRVLCLDIEGGRGGSSRSLYESLKYLDKDLIQPEVWCKQRGPIQKLYEEAGIPCRVVENMPTVNSFSVELFSRNIYLYVKFFNQFLKSKVFFKQIKAEVQTRFDIVHLNHESLFILARYLNSQTHVPLTMHIRTYPFLNVFSRIQAKIISKNTDHRIFISENEKEKFAELSGDASGSVIYNIAVPPKTPVEKHPRIPSDGRFKVACMSNYAWHRGVHLLADIASELKKMGNRNILFVVAGDMTLSGPLPGRLGEIKRLGGTLADYIDELDLDEWFLFLGHVSDPERVLASCDVLVKLALTKVPWGRDLLEAMAVGKPVISFGTYDRFVKTNVTGFLQPEFNALEMAQKIVAFAENPHLVAKMGKNAGRVTAELCNGTARAGDLVAVWKSVCKNMSSRHVPPLRRVA